MKAVTARVKIRPMTINRRITLWMPLIAMLVPGPVVNAQKPVRPNILFIAIDDLRPTLGCYGDKTAYTPNIDRFAGEGTVFYRAYCQQAVCSPSRLSLLTGRRPDTTEVWDLATHFREALPDAVTLPQHFKNQGYHTQSIGKIFHGSGEPSQDARSWSVEPQYDVVRDPKVRYALPENLNGNGLKRSATESANVIDETYVDGKVCNAAIQALSELKQSEQTIFPGGRFSQTPSTVLRSAEILEFRRPTDENSCAAHDHVSPRRTRTGDQELE